MGTTLKIICDVALKVVIEKRRIPGIEWDNNIEKKNDIKDLKKLVIGHWCNELSSLALKPLTERKLIKRVELPLASDINKLYSYISSLAENAYNQLCQHIEPPRNYKILTEAVFAQTIMFSRKRVGDVQYLKIETYNTDLGTTNQEAFTESLTPTEKLLSKRFKRVTEGGKGSKGVLILFSRKLQKYIASILKG